LEIERKFLVHKEKLPSLGEGTKILQAYLGFKPVVRVRVTDGEGVLTFKGKGLLSRQEIEVGIDRDTASALLDLRVENTKVIEKTRHLISYSGKTWELDIFEGVLSGLIVAEIELESEDEVFELPPWAGSEVTFDPAYQNSNLAGKNKWTPL
jgi:adenylate cyclase